MSSSGATGPLTPGTELGSYRIEGLLGEGGMGVVYRAFDTKLNRPAAIKLLSSDLPDAAARHRFQREAQTASSLNHPHILTVYDTGEWDGRHYLVTELVDGGTFRVWVNSERRTWRQVVELLTGVADGLAAAHQAGVLHRDLKPDNILVAKNGYAKLADFGLAKLTDRRDAALALTVTDHGTAPGMIVGTFDYMSPEQVSGKTLDERSDIFSFGVVLYEALAGRRPFQGAAELDVLHAILHDTPPPLDEDVPQALRTVVEKALERDPAERYQSMRDMVVDLRRLGRQSEIRHVVKTRRRRWLAATATVIAIIAGGSLLWQQRTQGSLLTDRDVLVLADFVNATGDSVFDGTMREALATQLEESPFLRTMSDDRVTQALQMMGRPSGGRVTNEIARDVCVREGEKAMIGGSISSLGKAYAILLQATNCQTGDTMAREQVQAEDKEHVLEALASAATGMRAKLGESLSSIQASAAPPDRVTTPSLQAFQAYARGREQFRLAAYPEAVPFFKRAIELDPNFAMAYWLLGTAYGNSGDPASRRQYLQKAFTMVAHVTERERLSISGDFYLLSGEWSKAGEALQLWTRTYPRDIRSHTFLGNLYNATGEFEKAALEAEEIMRLEPKFAGSFARSINAYRILDRVDEARATGERAIEQQVDAPNVHLALLRLAFVQGDPTAADQEIRWFAGKPSEYQAVSSQAANAQGLGQRRKAAELRAKAAGMARKQNLAGAAVQILTPDPASDALMGICPAAPNSSVSAIVMALCGSVADVQQVVDEASKRISDATLWNVVTLPSMRAALELRRDMPAAAIELLQSATVYDRAQPQTVYLRGLAYLRLGKKGAAAAATEFQKILDHKGAYSGFGDVTYAASHVGMARAAAISGDAAKAKKAYEDFLTLWKEADPGIPLLIEARNESAVLQ